MRQQISISNPSFFSLNEKELEEMSKAFHNHLDHSTVRGGPGKRKLSEEDKLLRILSGLSHQQNMETDPGHNKNGIMEYLIRGRSTSDKTISDLLIRLEKSGIITKRPSKKHERGDFYYYKTDKGNNLLMKIKDKRGLLPPTDDFE